MNPYPYKILPVVCPSLQATLKLDPSFVLEFFRIEALLRSPTVIKLYETTFSSWDRSSKENHHRTDTLRNKYNIIGGWQVLDGVHHEFHVDVDFDFDKIADFVVVAQIAAVRFSFS